jgi:hypothetical protein
MNPIRVIDMKMPLPALISGTVAVATFMMWMGWQAANQTNKMEDLILTTAKLEKRLDDRDARLDALRDTLFELRRNNDMNTMRITSLENKK